MQTNERTPALRIDMSRATYSSSRDDIDIRLIACEVDATTNEPYGVNSDSELYDLEIHAHGAHWGSEGRRVYGWSVEYRDCYRVGIDDAERMLKTFKRIERHLNKLNEKYGYADSLPAYVARVADALGIKYILRDAGKGQLFPTGHRFEAAPVGTGVNYLEHMIRRWIDEGNLPNERAA